MSYQISKYIAFQVTDYENAIAFYRDLLGFELIKQTPNESKMRKGDFVFYIEKREAEPLYTFFDLSTPDIGAAKESLLKAGCTITKQYGEKSMMMLDPYGFRFHLYEEGVELPDL